MPVGAPPSLPAIKRILKRKARAATQAVIARSAASSRPLAISHHRTCTCPPNNLNCMTAKEWLKSQIGVWQFFYEARDIRDKAVHPATFPLSLAKRVIELFTHKGELVLDPFVGSGTTLLAANDLDRNAVGFDLQEHYVFLCRDRIAKHGKHTVSEQLALQEDARDAHALLEDSSVGLIWTSPPYANLLNRTRQNKSRRDRKNGQLGKVEQYSQDPRDLGTMALDEYTAAMGDVFEALLPKLRPRAECRAEKSGVA